jgi:hypothetical protein
MDVEVVKPIFHFSFDIFHVPLPESSLRPVPGDGYKILQWLESGLVRPRGAHVPSLNGSGGSHGGEERFSNDQ